MATTTVPAAPTAVAAPTLKPTMYGQDYYNQIMSNMGQQAQTALTSPQASQTAAKNRESLAGSGALSGGAYDAGQAGWVQDLQNQYTQSGLQQVNTAKGEEATYEAGLPAQQFSLDEQAQSGNLAATSAYQSNVQNQLSAIEKAYPDMTKAPADVEKYYSELFSQMTGQPFQEGEVPETQLTPTQQAAQNAKFGGYADPETAYKTYTADPIAAAREGIVPGGSDTAVGWTPTAKGAGFTGSLTGTPYGLPSGTPVKYISSTRDKVKVQTPDGTTYEIDQSQYNPYG